MPPVLAVAAAAAAAVTATATIDAVTLLSCQNLHAYNNTSEHQHQHQHQDHRSQFHAHHDDKMSLTAESAAAAAEKVRSWYSHQVSLKMPLSLPLSPSRPMVIPTKGHSRRWESKHRDHSHHHHHHKHAGVPPAVAALLAVTAIPPPGARRQRAQRRRAQQQQQQQAALDISIQPPTPSDDISLCFEEALSDSLGLGLGLSLRLGLDSVALSRDPSRCSTRSTLSALLLGAPDEYDEDEEEEEEEEEEEDDDEEEEEEEEEEGGSTLLQKSPSDSHLSVRSGSGSDSSDSSDCVPSLEEDDDRSTFSWSSSTQSSSSSSSSPHSHRRSSASARMLASPSEECPFDHPLMLDPDADADCLDFSSPDAPHPPPQQPHSPDSFAEDALKRVTRRLNFKSNLTASLRVLRSAARSFSSISVAAPFTQPDDYLTRSILSITPQFTDERRPAPSLDAPTPALRRYLNPSCTAHPDTPCTGAVQMQTYYTSHPATSTDTDDWNPPAPTTTPAPTAPRPREVRENGDFLRVIVLEMNMRRSGKLSDTAHGKAKLVLPPRQPCKQRRALGNGRGRWEAWVCNYDE